MAPRVYKSKKKEFGDFQTPDYLAYQVCEKLKDIGITADTIIEPTCGVGSFIIAAKKSYPNAMIYGYELNYSYVDILVSKISSLNYKNIKIQQSNFFDLNWDQILKKTKGELLVVGNFPWVTNSTQGCLNSGNLPKKNNFLKCRGIEAITGKANFDISEWMLIESLSWFRDRKGAIAMLVKESVARKVISYSNQCKINLFQASIYKINAKEIFKASVDSCLMVLQFNPNAKSCYDYLVYQEISASEYVVMGDRDGLRVSNLDDYQKYKYLLHEGGLKWRSGIKHDSSSVMELSRKGRGYVNGFNEYVELEGDLLYPLMKGSDIGTNKEWREKFVLVTQKFVGMDTSYIKHDYPKTWNYLIKYSHQLDSRASSIYRKNPRFSIFGVGDYAFRRWKIAICSLYKKLLFRLIGPIEGKEVEFDDTVYFISFDSKDEAIRILHYLNLEEVRRVLGALIFLDDKRPIKINILNLLRLN